MPGIAPSLANSRKQIRQRSKSLIYERLRPQRKQRRTTRDLNFGVFCDLTITDVFAIMIFFQRNEDWLAVPFRVCASNRFIRKFLVLLR